MKYNLEGHLEELARQETIQAFAGSSGGVVKSALNSDQALARWRERFELSPRAPIATDALSIIDLDSGGITFTGGVPVNGTSHLTLRPDGTYTFSGHFHDSGFPSYNVELAWGIRTSQGRIYTFAHNGRVHGTDESGSRNDDWAGNAPLQDLTTYWQELSVGYNWSWRASANLDLNALVGSVVNDLKQAGQVVGVIAAIVA
jgi:hypothetical protein